MSEIVEPPVGGKLGIVYIATSKTSGKSYVGQTISKLYMRKRAHRFCALKKQLPYKFYSAIRELGWDDFEWRLLEEKVPATELDAREIHWIAKLNTFNGGYNSSPGGDYNPATLPSSRAKMSAARIGKLRTQEAKDKTSASLREFWESPESEQTREVMSARSKERWASPEFREKRSQSLKASFTPERREEISATSKEMWSRPEYRAKQSEAAAVAWTPERRARQSELQKIAQNTDAARAMRSERSRGAGNPKAKLTDGAVIDIWRRAHAGEKYSEIARDHGIDTVTVSHIKVGRTWGHVTKGLAL